MEFTEPFDDFWKNIKKMKEDNIRIFFDMFVLNLEKYKNIPRWFSIIYENKLSGIVGDYGSIKKNNLHLIDGLWNKISTDFIRRYLSDDNHKFDLRTLLLNTYTARPNDKGQNEGWFYFFCKMTNPTFYENLKHLGKNLKFYYKYLIFEPEKFFIPENDDMIIEEGNLLDMLDYARNIKWQIDYNENNLKIWKSDNMEMMGMLNVNSTQEASFIQVDNIYIYLAKIDDSITLHCNYFSEKNRKLKKSLSYNNMDSIYSIIGNMSDVIKHTLW